VATILYDRIMLNYRTCINDAVSSYFYARINNSLVHYNGADSYYSVLRNARRRGDYRRQNCSKLVQQKKD
jgi:hypothetical protein